MIVYRAPSLEAKFLRTYGIRLPRDGEAGRVVYFLRASNGLAKIGFASGLYQRMKTLISCSPIPIKIDAWIGGDEALEMALHARFRLTRVHGEWFVPTADYDEMVGEIREHLGCAEFAREFDARFVPIARGVMTDGKRKAWALSLGTKRRGTPDRDAFNRENKRDA